MAMQLCKVALWGEGLNIGRDGSANVTDDYLGDMPWAFTGGVIEQVIVDVGDEPYRNLELEAMAAFEPRLEDSISLWQLPSPQRAMGRVAGKGVIRRRQSCRFRRLVLTCAKGLSLISRLMATGGSMIGTTCVISSRAEMEIIENVVYCNSPVCSAYASDG
jgi:hypothetical protein